MSTVHDMSLIPGPGLGTAVLGVAGRSGLHARSLTLTPRGDELAILAVDVLSIRGPTVRTRLTVRYRGFMSWTETQHDGVLDVTWSWSLRKGALRLHHPTADADDPTEARLATWGATSGTPDLPSAVMLALGEAWSPPVPLTVALTADEEGHIGISGSGRRQQVPTPPPIPGDLVAVAGLNGLLRLRSQVGTATALGVTWNDGVTLTAAGLTPAEAAPPVLRGAPLVSLRRPVDALHDEQHDLLLDPAGHTLGTEGIVAVWRARVSRVRVPRPVELIGVHRGPTRLPASLTVCPVDGAPIELSVARARSAVATGALARLRPRPGLDPHDLAALRDLDLLTP